MIRKLEKADLDRVCEIWLAGNTEAHSFISKQYWLDNLDAVREMLPQSEVYLYEDEDCHEIQGFIGLHENYIEGIFVRSEARSRGIGRQLLDFAKTIRNPLTLQVYQKNTRAMEFYRREKFRLQCEKIDENTKEREYLMIWEP